MAAGIYVNIGSGNGLLPDGTKNNWTIVDLSTLRSSDVHLRAISFEISQPWVTKISLKIISLRFYRKLPGANELMMIRAVKHQQSSVCWNHCPHNREINYAWLQGV